MSTILVSSRMLIGVQFAKDGGEGSKVRSIYRALQSTSASDGKRDDNSPSEVAPLVETEYVEKGLNGAGERVVSDIVRAISSAKMSRKRS